MNFNLLSVPHLCAPLELLPKGPSMQELRDRGIQFADNVPESGLSHCSIDIVLGAGVIWDLLTSVFYRLRSSPAACETFFG